MSCLIEENYHKLTSCPICNNELILHDDLLDLECENNCFNYYSFRISSLIIIFIFGVRFETSKLETIEKLIQIDNKIKKEINYWKENDRYLIKILGG